MLFVVADLPQQHPQFGHVGFGIAFSQVVMQGLKQRFFVAQQSLAQSFQRLPPEGQAAGFAAGEKGFLFGKNRMIHKLCSLWRIDSFCLIIVYLLSGCKKRR